MNMIAYDPNSKRTGLSIQNINFCVEETEPNEHGIFYQHDNAKVEYTAYIGHLQLNGEVTIPYEEYKKMTHPEIVLYIMEKLENS